MEMALGKNIKKRMVELGWNERELHEQTKRLGGEGIKQQTINILIRRDSRRSMYVADLARALFLEEGELLSGIWNKDKIQQADAASNRAVSQPGAAYIDKYLKKIHEHWNSLLDEQQKHIVERVLELASYNNAVAQKISARQETSYVAKKAEHYGDPPRKVIKIDDGKAKPRRK